MKLKNKFILGSLSFVFLPLISNSCKFTNDNNKIQSNLNNNSITNKDVYEINIDGQKYTFKNIDEFVKNFDYESKTKKVLAVGNYSINDEKRFLINPNEYTIYNENDFNKVYKTKYNENVGNINEAYDSYMEEYAIMHKYFASKKGFESFDDARQYTIESIKKGVIPFCSYETNYGDSSSLEINPFSQNSINNFRENYLEKILEKDNNNPFIEFKNFYLAKVEKQNAKKFSIKTDENLNLFNIANAIYNKIINSVSFKIEINLRKNINDEILNFNSENDMGYKFILNEDIVSKGWKLKDDEATIFNEWDLNKWENFLKTKKEMSLIDVSNSNFETEEDKTWKSDTIYLKHFKGTNIKNILDINNLKVETNKFIYDKYIEDWLKLWIYDKKIISDFYIGTKFGYEDYGLGIQTNVERQMKYENILDELDIDNKLKICLDKNLKPLYEYIENRKKNQELNLFSSSKETKGFKNNNEHISEKEKNSSCFLLNNINNFKIELIDKIKNIFDEIILSICKNNINHNNDELNILVKEKGVKNHFLFCNNTNVSFKTAKEDNKSKSIVVEEEFNKIKDLKENNFYHKISKSEEIKYLNFVYHNILSINKEYNKKIKWYEPQKLDFLIMFGLIPVLDRTKSF